MSTDFTVYSSQATQNANLHIQPAGPSFPYGQSAFSSSGVSSSSTWHISQHSTGTRSSSVKVVNANRTPEELETVKKSADRLNSRLAEDQATVLHPDVDSLFVDEMDVINRLLPYHIFQQPQDDLRRFISGKGKERAVGEVQKDEICDTKFALECYKRREAVCNRWRNLKIRSGKRIAPDDQAYYLAQVVLDTDRSENAWLANELRTARTEVERIEKEKRAAANTARMTHFPSTPQPVMPALQAQYYRGYPYAYTQAYGNTAPLPTISTFPASPAPSSNYAPYQSTGAIPVQLPVASLPALHALGIIPVPTSSLPPEGEPQPPAVLRGSTANGTILSLEINVSLLQSTQMSGLAMVLNTLVARSNNTVGIVTNVPAVSQNTIPVTRTDSNTS